MPLSLDDLGPKRWRRELEEHAQHDIERLFHLFPLGDVGHMEIQRDAALRGEVSRLPRGHLRPIHRRHPRTASRQIVETAPLAIGNGQNTGPGGHPVGNAFDELGRAGPEMKILAGVALVPETVCHRTALSVVLATGPHAQGGARDQAVVAGPRPLRISGCSDAPRM